MSVGFVVFVAAVVLVVGVLFVVVLFVVVVDVGLVVDLVVISVVFGRAVVGFWLDKFSLIFMGFGMALSLWQTYSCDLKEGFQGLRHVRS